MNFYHSHTQFYCGIDLHSRNIYTCVIDRKQKNPALCKEMLMHSGILYPPTQSKGSASDWRKGHGLTCGGFIVLSVYPRSPEVEPAFALKGKKISEYSFFAVFL